jgi:hypothetical protein
LLRACSSPLDWIPAGIDKYKKKIMRATIRDPDLFWFGNQFTHGVCASTKTEILKYIPFSFKKIYVCSNICYRKLQSEPHDVDPTERLREMGGVICKSTFANHPSHLP